MKRIAVVLATTCVACGGDGVTAGPDATTSTVDARVDNGPCWPETDRMPQGSVVLGTGRGAFEPMPDVLPLEYGSQDGFMFITNVRMTGFDPGDAANILNPDNPRTRVRAFFLDTGVPLNRYAMCPFRTGYREAGTGEFELVQEAAVVFETCWRSDRLIGKQFRIELELLDAQGVGYASDTKIVTAGPPVAEYPDEQNTPPCP